MCALEGCVGMIYPGAFNTVTGPLHWALLQRCRAVDNQMFVATCSPSQSIRRFRTKRMAIVQFTVRLGRN